MGRRFATVHRMHRRGSVLSAATEARGDARAFALLLGVTAHAVRSLPRGMRIAAAGTVVLYLDTMGDAERDDAILYGVACLLHVRKSTFTLSDVESMARKLAELLAM